MSDSKRGGVTTGGRVRLGSHYPGTSETEAFVLTCSPENLDRLWVG